MVNRIIFLVYFFVCCNVLAGQEKPPSSAWALEGALGYSYPGITSSLGVSWKSKRFKILVSPKIVLDKSENPINGTFGSETSVLYYPTKNIKKFNGFAELGYYWTTAKSICPSGDCQKYNHIYEVLLGYGFDYKILNKIKIKSAIALGMYWEGLYNNRLNERFVTRGLNDLFYLGLIYEL